MTKTITKTFDFDPNITINQLLDFLKSNNSTLISLNPQPSLPLPSITIKFPIKNLSTINSIFN